MEIIKNILGLIISISSVLGIFTGIINKSFSKRLKPIEDKIDANEREAMKRDMNVARAAVINLAADLHRGIEPTKFQFDYAFDCMDMYEKYIKELNIPNNLFSSEEDYIKSCYKAFINKNN